MERSRKCSGVCPICGTTFESKYEKTFCSIQCYHKSGTFAEMCQKQRKKSKHKPCKKCGKEFKITSNKKVFCSQECYWSWKKGKTRKERVVLICEQCGGEFKKLESEITHERKRWGSRVVRFCSAHCYRENFAERYDRFVANPETIESMGNFDEFLTKEILSCPFDGCEWEGQHLGHHVNFTHGVKAEDFKEMCGFNRGTGLVTRKLSEYLSKRSSENYGITLCDEDGNNSYAEFVENATDRGKFCRRKESNERQSKAMYDFHAIRKNQLESTEGR